MIKKIFFFILLFFLFLLWTVNAADTSCLIVELKVYNIYDKSLYFLHDYNSVINSPFYYDCKWKEIWNERKDWKLVKLYNTVNDNFFSSVKFNLVYYELSNEDSGVIKTGVVGVYYISEQDKTYKNKWYFYYYTVDNENNRCLIHGATSTSYIRKVNDTYYYPDFTDSWYSLKKSIYLYPDISLYNSYSKFYWTQNVHVYTYDSGSGNFKHSSNTVEISSCPDKQQYINNYIWYLPSSSSYKSLIKEDSDNDTASIGDTEWTNNTNNSSATWLSVPSGGDNSFSTNSSWFCFFDNKKYKIFDFVIPLHLDLGILWTFWFPDIDLGSPLNCIYAGFMQWLWSLGIDLDNIPWKDSLWHLDSDLSWLQRVYAFVVLFLFLIFYFIISRKW